MEVYEEIEALNAIALHIEQVDASIRGHLKDAGFVGLVEKLYRADRRRDWQTCKETLAEFNAILRKIRPVVNKEATRRTGDAVFRKYQDGTMDYTSMDDVYNLLMDAITRLEGNIGLQLGQ